MEPVLDLAFELTPYTRGRLGGLLILAVPLYLFVLYRLLRVELVRRRDARTAAGWPTTTGTVVRTGTAWGRPPNPVPEMTGTMPGHEAEKVAVTYMFEVDGHAYEGDTPSPEELTRRRWGSTRAWKYMEENPAGSKVTVRYDPDKPTRNCADPKASPPFPE